jgi:hypothetical protein
MKTLILLLIFVSCGKNLMPGVQDYRDSDGDQILNRDETNEREKLLAGFQPLEKIEAEVELFQGISNPKKVTFILSNEIDLNRFSKDLMTTPTSSLKMSTYFSEFTSLRIQDTAPFILAEQESFFIRLKFKTLRSQPKTLLLAGKNEKFFLGPWMPIINLKLSKIQLQRILNGDMFLTLSFLDSKANFFHQTRAQSIEEKTYRIFYNNGEQTNTYYISKELSFDQVLSFLNVNHYKFIDEENLLTTTLSLELPEWWVRIINKNDIILVKDSLRNLSDHYLAKLYRQLFNFKRSNGKSESAITLDNHHQNRFLLTIRGRKVLNIFKETSSSHRRGGGRDGDHDLCIDLYRKLVREDQASIDLQFLKENLMIETRKGILFDEIKMRELKDESGTFWELEFPPGHLHVKIALKNLSPREYFPTGHYSSTCEPTYPILKTNEGYLDLNLEAYLEKI